MAQEKAVKMVEIRDRSAEELTASLERSRDELFRMNLARSTNQLTNTTKLKKKRHEIARILTVMSEREAAQGKEAKG